MWKAVLEFFLSLGRSHLELQRQFDPDLALEFPQSDAVCHEICAIRIPRIPSPFSVWFPSILFAHLEQLIDHPIPRKSASSLIVAVWWTCASPKSGTQSHWFDFSTRLVENIDFMFSCGLSLVQLSSNRCSQKSVGNSSELALTIAKITPKKVSTRSISCATSKKVPPCQGLVGCQKGIGLVGLDRKPRPWWSFTLSLTQGAPSSYRRQWQTPKDDRHEQVDKVWFRL